MKRVLLAGTALVGATILSSAAQAELNLDLGGHFRAYGVYADNDETSTAAPSDSLREFDLRRDAEVHFSGEATTDNGLTVGVHHEVNMESNAAVDSSDETYMYVSGGWGRVNVGAEDGAAYLLQVAAPSADSNVDGLRNYIQALNTAALGTMERLDYDHADFGTIDRFTYLTPKFNGFQGGLSYAPENGQNAVGNAVAGMATDDDLGEFEDLWEAAVRWDGEFEGFGISIGGGYSTADIEEAAAAPALGVFSDDYDTWNAGLNVTFGAFSLGTAYLNSDADIGDGAPAGDQEFESDTWIVGGAWDNGPYHLGVTYYDREDDNTGGVAGAELDFDRFTVGGGYTYGPGMTFRGAVAWGERDTGAAATSNDFTQVTVGTDVQF